MCMLTPLDIFGGEKTGQDATVPPPKQGTQSDELVYGQAHYRGWGVSKIKVIGGKEYRVLGSTMTYEGIKIVRKSYSTGAGKVVVQNGTVTHPDGTKTPE